MSGRLTCDSVDNRQVPWFDSFMHWVLGMAIFAVVFVFSVKFERVLKQARVDHQLICRETTLLSLCWWTFIFYPGVLVTWAILVGIPLTSWSYWLGSVAFYAVMDVVLWLLTRTSMGFLDRWQEMRRHRRHDEDCEYGPKGRRQKAAKPLRAWRKVAVNPAFSPA